MLRIRGNNFIALWVYAEQIFTHAQPALKFWQFLHGHPNACWANSETISSLAEHTRKQFFSACWACEEIISLLAEQTRKQFHRWLSIRGNDFIACWANEEMGGTARSIPSTEEETRLRRGSLINGGGDSSTKGETRLRWGRLGCRGGDSSTEGKIHLQRVRLFWGGGDSFFLMEEQNCWNLSVVLFLQSC